MLVELIPDGFLDPCFVSPVSTAAVVELSEAHSPVLLTAFFREGYLFHPTFLSVLFLLWLYYIWYVGGSYYLLGGEEFDLGVLKPRYLGHLFQTSLSILVCFLLYQSYLLLVAAFKVLSESKSTSTTFPLPQKLESDYMTDCLCHQEGAGGIRASSFHDYIFDGDMTLSDFITFILLDCLCDSLTALLSYYTDPLFFSDTFKELFYFTYHVLTHVSWMWLYMNRSFSLSFQWLVDIAVTVYVIYYVLFQPVLSDYLIYYTEYSLTMIAIPALLTFPAIALVPVLYFSNSHKSLRKSPDQFAPGQSILFPYSSFLRFFLERWVYRFGFKGGYALLVRFRRYLSFVRVPVLTALCDDFTSNCIQFISHFMAYNYI